METIDSLFGVRFSNIPLANLRIEFHKYLKLLQDETFQAQFSIPRGQIKGPYSIWYGRAETFLTHVMQQAILGLESYIVGAIYNEAGVRSMLDEEMIAKLRNPFLFRGRGTADNYYNKMPSVIDENYSLSVCDNELWDKTKIFYSGVRNPIFHGCEIGSFVEFPLPVLHAYEFVGKLYQWIDSWHEFEKFVPYIKIPQYKEGT